MPSGAQGFDLVEQGHCAPAILDARDAYDEAQDATALDQEPDGSGRSAGT